MVTIQLTIAVDGKPIRLFNGLGRIIDGLREWRRRAESRRDLLDFDGHLLRDIGLTRMDVDREVNKPFWQP